MARNLAPVKLEPAELGELGDDVQRRPRERQREIPYEPTSRPPLTRGFPFPDFEMPQPSSTPPEVVEAAVRRRARRIGETRTCDRCMRTSGMDTQWFWLKGTVQERTRFFAGLDPRMTDQVARRLAGRRIGFAQLCADCAAERQLPISATYGDINRVRETGVTALIGMAILDLHANMVPAAFRRR